MITLRNKTRLHTQFSNYLNLAPFLHYERVAFKMDIVAG